MGASRGRAALRLGSWIAILACTSLVTGMGCARRGKVKLPPTPDVVSEPVPEHHEPAPEDEEGIRLPGQSRYLPSEDPRNRPTGDTPAAPLRIGIGTEGKPESTPVPMRTQPTAPTIAPAAPRPPSPIPPGEARYRVQVFASSSPRTARSIREDLASRTNERVSVEEEGGIWRVRVGEPMTRENANALRRTMNGMGYHDAFVIEARPQ